MQPRCPPTVLLKSVASPPPSTRQSFLRLTFILVAASHRSSNLSPPLSASWPRRRLPEGRTGVVTHTPLSATCGSGRTLSRRGVRNPTRFPPSRADGEDRSEETVTLKRQSRIASEKTAAGEMRDCLLSRGRTKTRLGRCSLANTLR